MRFLVPGSFRMYSSRNVTCSFALPSLSARTVSAVIHALSRSRQFPHVQFPQCYMRFHSSFSFRRYTLCICTCGFALPSLSAGIIPAAVHAISLSLHFPHVHFPPLYMRFLPRPFFRTYNPCSHTYDFPLPSSNSFQISFYYNLNIFNV